MEKEYKYDDLINWSKIEQWTDECKIQTGLIKGKEGYFFKEWCRENSRISTRSTRLISSGQDSRRDVFHASSFHARERRHNTGFALERQRKKTSWWGLEEEETLLRNPPDEVCYCRWRNFAKKTLDKVCQVIGLRLGSLLIWFVRGRDFAKEPSWWGC